MSLCVNCRANPRSRDSDSCMACELQGLAEIHPTWADRPAQMGPLINVYDCTCLNCAQIVTVRWTTEEAEMWATAGLRCARCRGRVLVEQAVGSIGSASGARFSLAGSLPVTYRSKSG